MKNRNVSFPAFLTVSLLAVAVAQAAAPLAAQTQRDDFSAYPDGSEASPAWRTTSPFWEVRGGALVSEDAGREFAIFQACSPGSAVSVEADVTVTKSSGKDRAAWKVAGVAVYADIASFNRAWGTAFRDWTGLLESTTPSAARDEQARADAAAFLMLVGETYFATAEAAIRKADPNLMILGCRFAGRAPDGLWEVAGKHCDKVGITADGKEKSAPAKLAKSGLTVTTTMD